MEDGKSVEGNNFRGIGCSSRSSFSRVFTFYSPLKSAIEFRRNSPPEERKVSFSILIPRSAIQRTVKRRAARWGEETTVRKRNYSYAHVSLVVPPPVTKLETTTKQRVKKTNQNEEGGEKGTLKGRMDNERERESPGPVASMMARCDDRDNARENNFKAERERRASVRSLGRE